jgi:diguanylate cyclase (GGDEF)-like protein/PAS domain S-box-containing protein
MTKPIRLLLIADSEADAARVHDALQQGGFDPSIRHTATFDATREALSRDEWHAVLADPKAIDPVLVLDHIRSLSVDIPLLLVADSIDLKSIIRLLKLGVRDLILRTEIDRLPQVLESELAAAQARRHERATQRQRQLLATAAESAANAMFVTKADGSIEWTNAAFRNLSGYSADELIGQNLRILRSGVQSSDFYEDLWTTILAGRSWTGEVVERNKDGNTYSVHQTITPICDESGKPTHFIGIHEDITRRKEAEAKIEYLSYHDELTGLPNRAQFQSRLDQSVAHARAHGRLVGLLVVDLLRFKAINDTLGHGVGDLVLQETAKRLQECTAAGDIVCRVGGDEFAVIQRDLPSGDAASHLAERLLQSLDAPLYAHGQAVPISATIGLSIFPLDDPSGGHLLRNAEAAMSRAKAEGRRQASFSVAIDSQIRTRRELEVRLLQAIRDDEIVVHYQPQVELKGNSVIGMEALVRWQHPSRGLLYPGSFLADAEASGVIIPLSEHVIHKACSDYQKWFAGLPLKPRLAINISASHLSDNRLLQTVANALHESRLSPGLLELELTETALIRDESAAAKILSELSRQGILISIDDFGTGYSSLSYLKHLSIQKLKIDQSFVRNLPHDPDDAAIVRGTIALGHELGLKVIAEGVETPDHVAFLKRHQCDEAQGYHFFRPIPPETLAPILRAPKG